MDVEVFAEAYLVVRQPDVNVKKNRLEVLKHPYLRGGFPCEYISKICVALQSQKGNFDGGMGKTFALAALVALTSAGAPASASIG